MGDDENDGNPSFSKNFIEFAYPLFVFFTD
jgi:hypothetical protein